VRITVDVRDGIHPHDAIYRISMWYSNHKQNPEKYPMKGVVRYSDKVTLFKRDNRKGDCFVVYREASRPAPPPQVDI
jgi:hypothetical protein